MRPLQIIILLSFSQIALKAQHQNNHWYFGHKAGLNFNSSSPTTVTSELSTLEGSAVISDPSGNLLFYTDGITVWNREHEIMTNGTGLMGGASSTQSALIVPLPNSYSKYYIFTTQDNNTNGGLHYSIVDMNLEEGNGDIEILTKNTLIIDKTSEKVTSVLHSNGVDIWVITHTLGSNEFLAYLLTSSGLNPTPVISSIGSFYSNNGYFGPIKATHSGLKIVAASTIDTLIEQFDFNKATGEMTNELDLNSLFIEDQFVYGIEFSPNDSLLYLSTSFVENLLYQVDIVSGQIITLNSNLQENAYGALQLGPDNKIFMARNAPGFVDIIHQPNQKGLDCQYEEAGINFPDGISSLFGLPSYCVYSFFLPNNQILGRDTTLCAGGSIELMIDISKDCAPITVTWHDGSADLIKTINQPGTYWVEIESMCGNLTDTIQVDFVPCLPIVHYDLEDCESYMSNGTNMDYSEFVPAYPAVLPCADVNATNVFRSPPQENKHSCTPGISESVAMCISSHPSCVYEMGHQSSLVIEIKINPQHDSMVMLTGLEFFEKAPAQYSWIDGGTGENNYPTKYGIRILKNETEIYQNEEINTSTDWSMQAFNFLSDTAFRVKDSSLFRIELLPYCPIGNGAQVSAWDIDEIRFYGGCVPLQSLNSDVTGNVITKAGTGIPRVEMQLSYSPAFINMITSLTDASGYYSFPQIESGSGYYLQGYKNDDVLNGVSAIDLILIQKHLLGITPFTSLHQYIAADVNHSGRVNVLDLVLLQKLLLGSIIELPGNTSWRFGYLPQDMSDQDLSAFKEVFNIDQLNQSSHIVDFVGIKIGDLNGDAKLGRRPVSRK